MGWRSGEVWLDVDVLWFREQPQPSSGALAIALPASATALFDTLFAPVAPGLEAPSRPHESGARKRRLATRTVPAVALVLGSTTMLSVAALRTLEGAEEIAPLLEDPPSLTLRLDDSGFELPERQPDEPRGGAAPGPGAWRGAPARGVPDAGPRVEGPQLPVEGPDWVTWNPSTDSSPNLPGRLYGHERTIRTLIAVLAGHRAAHPNAPRVVVGDISFRHGGRMEQHVSHQNGLDVDVYYPRLDRLLRAPVAASQIDRALAQDLLDRFVAAGAKVVFVGDATGLRGESGVVVPYPNHENHMHVRFRNPG